METSWSQFPPTHGIASPRSLTVFRDISIISDLRVATYVENPLTWHPLQNLGRVKHSDIETLDCTRSPSQMLRNRAPHENNRKSREKPILWSFLAFTRHFYENFFLVLLKTKQIFVWFHFASIFSIFVRKNIFRCFWRTRNLNICLWKFASEVLETEKCKHLLEFHCSWAKPRVKTEFNWKILSHHLWSPPMLQICYFRTFEHKNSIRNCSSRLFHCVLRV